MEYRRLGKSGLPISELSFGSWITFGNQIQNGVSERLMDIAYEAGVNFFDNAEVYAAGASEVVMGEILHKKIGLAIPISLAQKYSSAPVRKYLPKKDSTANTS
jgi:aryl-alcohol dehydrogenase-like predicted oxidoreductase